MSPGIGVGVKWWKRMPGTPMPHLELAHHRAGHQSFSQQEANGARELEQLLWIAKYAQLHDSFLAFGLLTQLPQAPTLQAIAI